LSRGRNIKLFNSFHDIITYTDLHAEPDPFSTSSSKSWVVQKYIERPLLIQGRKFDIRAWVVVTCWNPLTIYLYKECYIRFSASNYDPSNTSNLFIHLTNNSISKHCTDKQSAFFGQNMWSLDQFKEYLDFIHPGEKGLWDMKLEP
jgi:tubulin monoglycylase TTLL3/8